MFYMYLIWRVNYVTIKINWKKKDEDQVLDRPLWPRSSEGQGQGQYISGPNMEGQGQVHKKSPRPGPDQTSDSLNWSGPVQFLVFF